VSDITPLDDLDAQLGMHKAAIEEPEVEKHVQETPENEHETEDVYTKEEKVNE
jgi:hypothetical protein